MLPLIKFGKIEVKPATTENKQNFCNEAGKYYEIFAIDAQNQQNIIRIDGWERQFCENVKDVFAAKPKNNESFEEKLQELFQKATNLNNTKQTKLETIR